MKVVIRSIRDDRILYTFKNVLDENTILDVKRKIRDEKRYLHPSRQSLRLEPKGKALTDNRRLVELFDSSIGDSMCLYFRDLGPQIGWRTVFLVEYAGPLIIYAVFWLLRQPGVPNPIFSPITDNLLLRKLAMLCWCGHYAKRLAETIFVHRFSHATMPMRNLFKNSSYYFGFTAFVAYFTNHRMYTAPYYGQPQIYIGLALFLLAEFGNFSCHLTLKRLRPPGTSVRRIPLPMPGWPLTRLFKLVSCPHYMYEALAWLGFTIMTQTLPAALFTLAGFIQMSIWAKGKWRAYRREFPDYPKHCKAIVPFVM